MFFQSNQCNNEERKNPLSSGENILGYIYTNIGITARCILINKQLIMDHLLSVFRSLTAETIFTPKHQHLLFSIQKAIADRLVTASNNYDNYANDVDNGRKRCPEPIKGLAVGFMRELGGWTLTRLESFVGDKRFLIEIYFPETLFLNKELLKRYMFSAILSYLKENKIQIQSSWNLFSSEWQELCYDQETCTNLESLQVLTFPKPVLGLVTDYLYIEPEAAPLKEGSDPMQARPF